VTGYTWKTGTSANWNNNGAWIGGIPNGTTADVTISVAGAYTVTLPSGTAYTVDSVLFNNSAASFSDAGTLTLGGLEANFTFDGNEFMLASTGVITGGLLDIDSGELFNQGGALKTKQLMIGAGGEIALNGKALTYAGAAVLDGDILGNNAAGNTLAITGSAAINDTIYLEDRATLVVAGTVTQSGPYDFLYLGNSGSDASLLDILGTGTYSLGVASAYTAYYTAIIGGGDGTVVNAGRLINSDPNWSGVPDYISAVVDSTGTIESDSGDLQLDNGGSIGGKLTGAGEIDFYSGNFLLSPTIAVSWSPSGVPGANSIVQLTGSNVTITYNSLTSSIYQLDNGYSTAKLQVSGGKLSVESGGYSYGEVLVTGGTFDALTGYDFVGLVSLGSAGTLEDDNGSMDFSGGAVLGGTIAGDNRLDGQLFFTGGNVALNSGFTVAASAVVLNFTGAALSLGANQTIAAPVVF